jgi:AcrR family transcriptional regulator
MNSIETMNKSRQRTEAASPTRRRNPKGEGGRLREELIEAAAEMIAESGDASRLTLRGVARRVGIAAPSIYRHFSDVEHLKMAVVDRAFGQFATERDRSRNTSDDPRTALLAGCRAYCRFALSNPGIYRFMFREDSPGRERRSRVGDAAFAALVESIRRCQEEGVTTIDDADAAAAEVWAALHGLSLLHLNLPDFGWRAPLEDMATDAVTRLLGLEPGPRSPQKTRKEKQ